MKLLPLDYAVRNLGRSKLRLFLSLFGSALVVILVVLSSSFIRGMETSLMQSSSEKNVILLGAGSEESVERSEISPSVSAQLAATVSGIRSKLGIEFISPEVHMGLRVSTSLDGKHEQLVVRGVHPQAFLVHPQVRLIAGRSFTTGADEIIIGRMVATRLGLKLEQLPLDSTLFIDGREWKIVGHFEAPNTVMDGEIWAPLTNLQILTKRESLSCVVLTLDTAEFSDIEMFVFDRGDLELAAIREDDYYQKLNEFYGPIKIMIWITAALIALGGLLGGLNTMYAAFASRTREVGMLQSLGYSRWAIFVSFVQESLLAACGGTVLGVLACFLFFSDVSVRFSMGTFALLMDAPVTLTGIAAGILLGLLGAMAPVIQCLKIPITDALKAA